MRIYFIYQQQMKSTAHIWTVLHILYSFTCGSWLDSKRANNLKLYSTSQHCFWLEAIAKSLKTVLSLHSTYSDLKCHHNMHVVESNQLLYCLVGKKGPSTTPFPLTIAKLQSPIYIWRHLKGIQPILKLHDLRD